MNDRPFEFVHIANSIKPKLLDIINDKYLYSLTEPDVYMKQLTNMTSDILKRFKQLTVDDTRFLKVPVVRNFGFGVPAGTTDLQSFSKWSNFYGDKQISKNSRIKNEIKTLVYK